MTTSPEAIRRALTLVTASSIRDLEQTVQGAAPEQLRPVLFAAAPLIVSDHLDGTAALALDWYDELRDLSNPTRPFVATVVTNLREDYIDNAVAWATESLADIATDLQADLDAEIAKLMADLGPVIQKEVATGFWDTVTENVARDPEAVGWQRFTRGPGSCSLCRMLADKGAVYKADTARFAAHKSCHCVAAPVFDGQPGKEASVLQYTASQKRRSDADRARLREYLKKHYSA